MTPCARCRGILDGRPDADYLVCQSCGLRHNVSRGIIRPDWTSVERRPPMTEGITAMARVAWIPGDPKFKFKPEPDSHAEETLPMSVRNAVMLVNDYFSSRGITTFEIGPLCSRDHATKLHRIRDILKP